MSTNCPFFASGHIQSPELFIGRNYELTVIAHRMTGPQPTSVNVCGPRRIGKSSLLYHFCLTWENRIKPEERQKFAVAYVSVATMSTETEFYQELAKLWRGYAPLQKNVAWQEIWRASEWTRPRFNEALKACKETVKVLPVVCLDDVETMLKRPQEFDNGFYDNLRAAMGSSQLMLVVASFEPLHAYKARYQLTSLFFNQGQTVELKQFTSTEVETLLLWAGKANFNKQQKQRMRQWGEQHPYLLQLAGVYLWDAQVAGKDEHFAKQQFEADKQRNLFPTLLPNSSGFPNPLKWLGQFAKQVGHWWHESHETVYGLVIVIAVILAILYGLGITVMKLGWHPFEFVTHVWNAVFGTHPEGH